MYDIGKIPVHGRLKAHFHDNQAVLFSRNLLHPHPDGLSARPKAGYWYRDSPVYRVLLLPALLRLDANLAFNVFCCKSAFCQRERTSYCVNKEFCQISSIQVVRLSPLTSCSKYPICKFSQFTGAGNRRNQPEYFSTMSSFRFRWRRPEQFSPFFP